MASTVRLANGASGPCAWGGTRRELAPMRPAIAPDAPTSTEPSAMWKGANPSDPITPQMT